MNETKAERGLQVVANFATILSATKALAYVMIIFGVPIIMLKAERAVTVLENMDERVERAFEGAVPLGSAAVTKGIESVQSVDGEALGTELTDAAKRLLRGKKR